MCVMLFWMYTCLKCTCILTRHPSPTYMDNSLFLFCTIFGFSFLTYYKTTNSLKIDFSLGNQIRKYFTNSVQFETPKWASGYHAKFSKYLTAGPNHSPKLGKRTEISKQKALLYTQREIPTGHRLLNPYPGKYLNPSVWSVFPAKIFLLELCL